MKLPNTAHVSRPAPAGGAAGGAPTSLGDLALQVPKLMRRITAVHGTLFLRAQNGPLARWFGLSILVLETVGRRTGRLRATPLAYLSHGDELVVVPANAGAARPPAWWLNLQAAGEGVAILDNQRRAVRPRIAADTEHQQLWRRLAGVAPIDHYQRRTRRPLPIVVLEPTGVSEPQVQGYGPLDATCSSPRSKRSRRKGSSSGSPPSAMSSAARRPIAKVLKPWPESTIA
jgi:F420H(2)-dependent quinone reductase